MSELLKRAKYLLSEADPKKLEAARAEVAFVGRSNVGKSTLLNSLCQQRGLAKVSNTPGRTRTINVFAVDYLRWIVDLPGYGFAVGPSASREGWAKMIEGYLSHRPSLRGVFLLFDAKVGPTKLDHQMREWLSAYGLAYTLVGNKIDQVKPSQLLNHKSLVAQSLGVSPSEIRWVSAAEGFGIGPLRQEVVQLLQWKPEDAS